MLKYIESKNWKITNVEKECQTDISGEVVEFEKIKNERIVLNSPKKEVSPVHRKERKKIVNSMTNMDQISMKAKNK